MIIDTADSRSEAQEVIEEDIKYQSADEADKITYTAVKATEEEYLNDTFSTWTNQLTTYILKDGKFELK